MNVYGGVVVIGRCLKLTRELDEACCYRETKRQPAVKVGEGEVVSNTILGNLTTVKL